MTLQRAAQIDLPARSCTRDRTRQSLQPPLRLVIAVR